MQGQNQDSQTTDLFIPSSPPSDATTTETLHVRSKKKKKNLMLKDQRKNFEENK